MTMEDFAGNEVAFAASMATAVGISITKVQILSVASARREGRVGLGGRRQGVIAVETMVQGRIGQVQILKSQLAITYTE